MYYVPYTIGDTSLKGEQENGYLYPYSSSDLERLPMAPSAG
jgi:hypothetical protein